MLLPTNIHLLAADLNITNLDLFQCSLSGPFPDELFDMLYRLQSYNFDGNSFDVDPKTIRGKFILAFKNLTNQSVIDLSGQGLIGTIPRLPDRLQQFNCGFNRLTGPLPALLPENLEKLNVAGNKLTGPLPDVLPQRLVAFLCYGNEFSGGLPRSVPMGLELFYCSNNKLTPTDEELACVQTQAPGCALRV
jgi:hypothetical protein